MNFLTELPFLPELLIAVVALLALIMGAFNINRVASLSIIVAILVGLVVTILNPVPTNHGIMLNGGDYVKWAKILICFSSLLILLMALNNKRQYEFNILIALSTVGMMFLISSNNLLIFFVSLELMSLPLYILTAFDRQDSKSTEAGMKYFILGSVASCLFLLGTSFVYGFTGSINFQEIYSYYVNLDSSTELVAIPIGYLTGLILVIIALAFKISAVPFHMWAPDVYNGAPTIVTAFLASAPKVASLMALANLLFDPFAQSYVQWQQILIFLSVASMFIGSLGAIMQTNFKRLLAYSSIGHVGFMLAGLATAENEGLSGFLIYLVIYLTMVISMFGCLMIIHKNGKLIENISDVAGLAKAKPTVAMGLTILLLSMAGIPPVAGFFAKFYLLIPLIKSEMYITAILFIISSVTATYYYLKVIKIMYFDNTEAAEDEFSLSGNLITRVIIGLGVAFNVLFILAPSPLIKTAKIASIALIK